MFMAEKKWEPRTAHGHKRLVAYFDEVIRTDGFQSKVQKLREKHAIPISGYTFIRDGTFHPIPPKEWMGVNKKEYGAFMEDIQKLCEQYDLFFPDWYEAMQYCLFFNRGSIPYPIPENLSHDLMLVSDVIAEKSWQRPKNLSLHEEGIFPIALRISPYASGRDISDYIKNYYTSEIRPLQEKYKKQGVRTGKVNTKNLIKQEIQDFIHSHNTEPLKTLEHEIAVRFKEHLDVGHIGKIISLQKKRRKQL